MSIRNSRPQTLQKRELNHIANSAVICATHINYVKYYRKFYRKAPQTATWLAPADLENSCLVICGD